MKECPSPDCHSSPQRKILKDGFFYRRGENHEKVQRYKCSQCSHRFSSATLSFEYRQQKRKNNEMIYQNLTSGVSMRRSARNLKLSRGTIQRRLTYFARKARYSQEKFLKMLKGKVSKMQFDDLISKESTKLKPLTVSIAADAAKRWILGAEVGSIGARGHLSSIALKKYGHRKNEHQQTLTTLFSKIASTLSSEVSIASDEDVLYEKVVKEFAPQADYRQYKSRKARDTGQGEMKKGRHDPLFTINHTCAMLRDNISRLVRKTWSISKKKEKLQEHIDVYIDYYNQIHLMEHKKISI